MHRRHFLAAGLALPALPRLLGTLPRMTATAAADTHAEIAAIERRVGGRLGVAFLDTASGRRFGHRAGERFPLCSTFKLLLAAQVLARVDAGQEQLTRMVGYGPADLLEYAPVTRANLAAGGMTVRALCEAAVSLSDNTAANLLLATAGGPAGLTAFLRASGDGLTRLDRNEPDLNTAIAGDPRDTTTPAAMLAVMRTLLLGRRLTPESRALLVEWLLATSTGAAKLRAGVPPSWRVGDKTGMGANGSTNDVAIAWATDRRPILVTAYLTGTSASVDDRNAAIADVGKALVTWLGAPSPQHRG
ncbi:MAG: class A beta-lactamase [Gemmatimonadaceae bacterium]|nr:class A beta-lactamase [Gemmatimonadaceae bacterium]